MQWDYVLQHGTFRLRDLEKFFCRLEKEGRVLNRVKQVINLTKRAEVSCLPAGTRKPVGRKQVILVSFFLHDNRVLLSVRRGARKFGMEKRTVVRAPSCSPSIVLISLSVSG